MAELGTLMRAGLEGYDAGTDRVAKEKATQLGLDDAKFQSQRRKKVAGREDVQYDRKENQYQREVKGKQVINNAMVNDDFSGVQDYLNEFTRDGADHFIKRNKDGSFDGILEIDGKQVKKKFKDSDELMQYTMMVSKNDPFAELGKRAKTKAAAGLKESDRKHDMAKIDRKGQWDLTKEGLKQSKKGGSKAAEALRKIANDMEARSKSRRGTMTAMGNYDMAGISANLANYDGVIGVRMVDKLGLDVNAAYTKSYNIVSQLHKSAETEALEMFPDDDIKQTEHIRAVLERGVDKVVKSIEAKAGKGLKQKPAAGTATTGTAKTPPYEQFLKDFKAKNKGATDADAKRMYDEWFPGAKADVKPEDKASGVKETPMKKQGLSEPKEKVTSKKMSHKEEVELYRTPTRKSTRGFSTGKETAGAKKAKDAANKAVKKFKQGITLSEPELRLALNGETSERIQRSIIKEIKKIKSKRKGK